MYSLKRWDISVGPNSAPGKAIEQNPAQPVLFIRVYLLCFSDIELQCVTQDGSLLFLGTSEPQGYPDVSVVALLWVQGTSFLMLTEELIPNIYKSCLIDPWEAFSVLECMSTALRSRL